MYISGIFQTFDLEFREEYVNNHCFNSNFLKVNNILLYKRTTYDLKKGVLSNYYNAKDLRTKKLNLDKY